MKRKNIIVAISISIILIIIAMIVIGKIIKSNNEEYEVQEVKEYNYFVLKQNNQYGVIDKKGNTVVLPKFTEVIIPNPEKAVFICYEGEDTKVLNDKNEEILTKYQNVQAIRLKNVLSDLLYEKGVLKYEKDGKYGVITLDGKELMKPTCEEVDTLPFKEGELLIKKDNKYGVINSRGKTIVGIQYDEIKVDEYYTLEKRYKYAGYIVSNKTEEEYRYGYLNHKGKEILKLEYNDISRITEIQDNENSYLICAKNGQYGVTKNENQVLNNEYQSIHYDANNQILVIEKSKKYGVVNLEAKEILPMEYGQIDVTGNYLYAKKDNEVIVYNKDGAKTNISANISILNTNNENYKIRIDNENESKYGVIDKDGKVLIEEKYNYIEYLNDNYFIVSNENGKLGILNDKGNEIVEINKDSIQRIENTELIQAALPENKVTQIYDRTMKMICEMQNATINVEDDYIKVFNDGELKYFSKQGKELKNTEVYANNQLFVAMKDNRYGFVDKNGNLVVDYQYEKAYEFNSYGFATVKKDGKWGAINEKGQEVVEPVYEIRNQREPFFIGNYYRVTYGFGEFYYTDAK